MKTKQGVSLIVLVITIIVMIILAGTIIISLNNSGILEKANEAVEETNLANVKELTQMAWANAYAEGARTEEELKAEVDKALEDNKVDVTKYKIKVTTSGVTVKLKVGPWEQDGVKVTNGTITLEVGDSIAYDETNGGTITGLTATEWNILGASEDGELLIVSKRGIKSVELGSPMGGTDIQEAEETLQNAVEILDSTCEEYGKGEGAIAVRSIRVEDIDRITGFDKNTYGKGTIAEYGNEVTFMYNGTTSPEYVSSNGVSGTLGMEYNTGFHYYNGENIVVINDLTTGTKGNKYATLKNNAYHYSLNTINGTKASNLFLEICWLANSYIGVDEYEVAYGLFILYPEVGAYEVSYCPFWMSWGEACGDAQPVRPVVTLSPDIQLTGSSETGWTY